MLHLQQLTEASPGGEQGKEMQFLPPPKPRVLHTALPRSAVSGCPHPVGQTQGRRKMARRHPMCRPVLCCSGDSKLEEAAGHPELTGSLSPGTSDAVSVSALLIRPSVGECGRVKANTKGRAQSYEDEPYFSYLYPALRSGRYFTLGDWLKNTF